MRRALPLLAVAVLATACGDASTESSATPAPSDTAAPSDSGAPSDTGAPSEPTTFEKPEVVLPEELPTELVVTELTPGFGPEAQSGDGVVVHYVGVRSEDGEEFDNSYDRGEPFPVTLGQGGVIAGWDEGLIGAQQGQRLQLDIPSDMAYGDDASGGRPAGPLTFVVDVVAVLPSFTIDDAPDVTVEPAANVTEVEYEDLVEGDGAVLAEGRTAVVHLLAYRADTGELLSGTWGTPPLTFVNDAETEVFSGLLQAVDGMKVGGRRQAQIPYPLMFDGQGNEQLGLPTEVDLVVVLDLVSQY